MGRRLRYVATDTNPLYLHTLQNRFLRTPNVTVGSLNPSIAADFEPYKDCFEAVLCVNVLEYTADPGAVLRSIRGVLRPGGIALILAPQSPHLFSSLDRTMGHLHRFREPDLRQLLETSGLRGRRSAPIEQGRIARVVALRQSLPEPEDQQIYSQTVRQERLDPSPH